MMYDTKTTERVPCGEFTIFSAEHQFLRRIKELMADEDMELSLYMECEEVVGLESLLARYEQQAETHTTYLE
jgi:hypothetical protein